MAAQKWFFHTLLLSGAVFAVWAWWPRQPAPDNGRETQSHALEATSSEYEIEVSEAVERRLLTAMSINEEGSYDRNPRDPALVSDLDAEWDSFKRRESRVVEQLLSGVPPAPEVIYRDVSINPSDLYIGKNVRDRFARKYAKLGILVADSQREIMAARSMDMSNMDRSKTRSFESVREAAEAKHRKPGSAEDPSVKIDVAKAGSTGAVPDLSGFNVVNIVPSALGVKDPYVISVSHDGVLVAEEKDMPQTAKLLDYHRSLVQQLAFAVFELQEVAELISPNEARKRNAAFAEDVSKRRF